MSMKIKLNVKWNIKKLDKKFEAKKTIHGKSLLTLPLFFYLC